MNLWGSSMRLFKPQYRIKVEKNDLHIRFMPQYRMNIFSLWEDITSGWLVTFKEVNDCIRRHKKSQYLLKHNIYW